MLRTARKIAKRLRNERNMSENLDNLMVTRIAETQQSSYSASDITVWEKQEEEEYENEKGQESIRMDRMQKEKTPEELDEERQKEEDREDNQEEEEDLGKQEAEMTMMVDSGKMEENGEEMEVDEEEEDEEEEEKVEKEMSSEGEEDEEEDVLQWITTRSAFDQKFTSMNRRLRSKEQQQEQPGEVRRYSRASFEINFLLQIFFSRNDILFEAV